MIVNVISLVIQNIISKNQSLIKNEISFVCLPNAFMPRLTKRKQEDKLKRKKIKKK